MDVDRRLQANELGVYFESSAKVKKAKLTIGIREDYHSLIDATLLSPRVNLEYQATPSLNLFTGYGLYGQPPELVWLVTDDNNLDLPYFKAVHLTAGFNYSPEAHTKFKVEAYYKKYLNYPVNRFDSINTMIDYGTDFSYYETRQITDSGSGFSRGIELTLRRAFSDQLTGILGLTLHTSRYAGFSDVEIEGSFDTRYQIGLSVCYRPAPWLESSVKFANSGGKPYTPIDQHLSRVRSATIRDYSRINQEHYPSYHRLDTKLAINHAIGAGRLSVYIEVINVYNRRNVWFYYWESDGDRQKTIYDWRLLPIAGISYEW